MPHTTTGSAYEVLHLRLWRPSSDGQYYDLLLPDLTGELFSQALNSKEDTQSLKILNRADHVSLLVDGSKLNNLRTRQLAKNEIDLFIRSCIESDMLDRDSMVEVIATKEDLFMGENEIGSSDVGAFLTSMEGELKSKYEGRLRSLEFLKVAALPKAPSTLNVGHGIGELPNLWLKPSQPIKILHESLDKPESDREFDFFMWRAGQI